MGRCIRRLSASLIVRNLARIRSRRLLRMSTKRPRAERHRLWLAGTESAREHGGYLEGALEAAEVAAQKLLSRLSTTGC